MSLPEPFPNEPDCGYRMQTAIDWNQYRAVVFESDDWGACETLRDHEDAVALEPVLKRMGRPTRSQGTLESPADLERLYATLEAVRGCDNQQAVFTAFMPMGNPDYAAIAASGFQGYYDIGLDEGVPPGWERGDLTGKWREGVARGVFSPEFHAGLHHISPILWLELLRDKGPDSHNARTLFAHGIYTQAQHLPEYHGMNAGMQHEWVGRAVARFKNLFGYVPRAGVSSDTLSMTEVVWAVNGLKIFCLKNCRLHDGSVVTYDTKPWNSQDPDCPMGAYNRRHDLVYLSRNFHLDNVKRESLSELTQAASASWQRNEPVVVNTHRINYVGLDPQRCDEGYETLTALLNWLAAQERVRFLTTAELGQLYRDGYSIRQIGAQRLLRQWSQPVMTLEIPGSITRVLSLPGCKEQPSYREGDKTVVDLKQGDYLLL